MREIDTTSVAEFIPLSPCTRAGNGTVTSGYAAVDGAWELRVSGLVQLGLGLVGPPLLSLVGQVVGGGCWLLTMLGC